MYLFTHYTNTNNENIFIKYTIHFNKDTFHWATSAFKQKGYQVTATPITVERKENWKTETSTAFNGFYEIIYPIERQSNKRAEEAIKKFKERLKIYNDFFRKKGFNIDDKEDILL